MSSVLKYPLLFPEKKILEESDAKRLKLDDAPSVRAATTETKTLQDDGIITLFPDDIIKSSASSSQTNEKKNLVVVATKPTATKTTYYVGGDDYPQLFNNLNANYFGNSNSSETSLGKTNQTIFDTSNNEDAARGEHLGGDELLYLLPEDNNTSTNLNLDTNDHASPFFDINYYDDNEPTSSASSSSAYIDTLNKYSNLHSKPICFKKNKRLCFKQNEQRLRTELFKNDKSSPIFDQ